MSDIQMGGINFATNLADQFCHTYYKTGYEKGKVDTLRKLDHALEIVKGVASGKGDFSESNGLYEAVSIIKEQMEE